MCQKWLDEVFRVLSKVSLGNYSDFLYMKLQQHEDLKSMQMILLGTTLFMSLKWPKRKFFSYYQKLMNETFLISCINLQQDEDLMQG